MISVLSIRTYRHLFLAQVIALFGTGLMTVALALLAYDLAGADAGMVLGTALAIKMIVYVTLSPVAAGFATRFPRRIFLIFLDLVRAATALALPFVDAVWQIYVLIAVLQSASAAFTPTFQATIPDILPDEDDYTNALSLSRIAYDLENLLSPVIAAVLVSMIGFHWLFAGTVAGFLFSAALIVSVALPDAQTARNDETALKRIRQGLEIYLKTPRLKGLLALNLTIAAAGAMVIVNGVVIVKSRLGLTDTDLALSMAAYGGGSMLMALFMPKILAHRPERALMLSGATLLPACLVLFAVLLLALPERTFWPVLLVTWFLLGAGMSAILVSSGRLIRNSAHSEDRPLVFAAQFALSHACWLIAYPFAGWMGSNASVPQTLLALAFLAAPGIYFAHRFWPREDPGFLVHDHPDLPPDHPHLIDTRGRRHAHAFVIDRLHPSWPDR